MMKYLRFSYLLFPALLIFLIAARPFPKTTERLVGSWAEKDSLRAGYNHARKLLLIDGQTIFAEESNGYPLGKSADMKFKTGYIYTLIYITSPMPTSTAAHQGANAIRVFDQDHTIKDAKTLTSSRLNEKGCQMYAVKVEGYDKYMSFRFDSRYNSMYIVGEKKE